VIKTTLDGNEKTARVIATRCMARATYLLPPDHPEASSLKNHGIKVVQGDIASKMHERGERPRVFVLPSQLNAAEYQSAKPTDIVKILTAYIYDRTGGPAGQLAGDPGVAQFIIDSACNDKSEGKGVNNVRLMGVMNGITLKNGYLQVASDADVGAFKRRLPDMTVVGVRDVPVRGLNRHRSAYPGDNGVTVDLIYASAVPVVNYDTTPSKALSEIADLTLLAQYTGSMRLAAERGKCDLYLMLLGGFAFGNKRPNIRAAIIGAYKLTRDELRAKGVTVHVLTYNADEHAFFDT
jgi:hypothetical protein